MLVSGRTRNARNPTESERWWGTGWLSQATRLSSSCFFVLAWNYPYRHHVTSAYSELALLPFLRGGPWSVSQLQLHFWSILRLEVVGLFFFFFLPAFSHFHLLTPSGLPMSIFTGSAAGVFTYELIVLIFPECSGHGRRLVCLSP